MLRKGPIQELLDIRRKIQADLKNQRTAKERHQLEDRLQEIEEKISVDCEAQHYSKITEQLQKITNKNGSTNAAGMWKLRKKMFPKPIEHLTSKKDKNGHLVPNPEALKEIYINGYVE